MGGAAAIAEEPFNPQGEETRAWKTHVRSIRPELRTPRASVNIQLGESDSTFQEVPMPSWTRSDAKATRCTLCCATTGTR